MNRSLTKSVLKVLLLLFFFYGNLNGENLNPKDFAYGIPVEVDETTSFYSFPLPVEVYESVTSKGLDDLRMFNGSDELVPFIIKSEKGSMLTVEKKAENVIVPIFPVYGKPSNDKSLSLLIKKDRNGSIIRIEDRQRGQMKGRITSSYIADLSKYKRKPVYLDFRWSPKENFTAGIIIEESNDLTNFSTLVQRATLVDMEYGKNRLQKNRVYLPYFSGKYLRIRPAGAGNGFQMEIIQVTAHLSETSAFKKVDGKIISPKITKSDIGSGDYLIELTGFFPVKRLRINLPQKNTIVKYKLFKGDSFEDVYPVKSGTLYNLNADGTVITNDDIYIDNSSGEKFWILRVDESEGGIGKLLPEITMEYNPHILTFTARGEKPFKLLFGKYGFETIRNYNGTAIEQLSAIKNINLIKDAKVGTMFESGGLKMLLPPPKPFSYKKYVLWGVLLFGVMLTAYMAYRLISQMNREE